MEISPSSSPQYSSPPHSPVRKGVIKSQKNQEEVTSEKETSGGIKFVCPSFFPWILEKIFRQKPTQAKYILKQKEKIKPKELSIPKTSTWQNSLAESTSSPKNISQQSSFRSNISSPKNVSRHSSFRSNTSSPNILSRQSSMGSNISSPRREKPLLKKLLMQVNPAVVVSKDYIKELYQVYIERLENKEEIPINLEKIIDFLSSNISERCVQEVKRLQKIKKDVLTNEPRKKQKQKQKENIILNIIEHFNDYQELQNNIFKKSKEINEILIIHKSQTNENLPPKNKFFFLEEDTQTTSLNERDDYSNVLKAFLDDISEIYTLFEGSYYSVFLDIDKIATEEGSTFKNDMVHHRNVINKIVKDLTNCLLDRQETESEPVTPVLEKVALQLRDNTLLDSWQNYIKDNDYQTGKWQRKSEIDIELSTDYFPSKMKFSLSEESVKHIRKRHPDFLKSIKVTQEIVNDNEGYNNSSPRTISDVRTLKAQLSHVLSSSKTMMYKSASYTNPETKEVIDTPALKCATFLENDKTYFISVWKLYKNNGGINLHLATAYLDDFSGCKGNFIKISQFADGIDNPEHLQEGEITPISPKR